MEKNKDKLALVLTGGEDRKDVIDALKRCGWCEFRVDEFLKRDTEEKLKEWISIKAKVKKIGTVRWHREHQGNGLKISEGKRLKIYKDVIAYVDYVDVEIRSSIVKNIIMAARERHKKVILSYHNFSKTPSYNTLKKIYNQGKRLKPDIIKFATKVNSSSELFTLLSFTYNYSKKLPLIITPMGVSFIERLIPLYLGSLFTYISLEKKTASGQISYRDIKKLDETHLSF